MGRQIIKLILENAGPDVIYPLIDVLLNELRDLTESTDNQIDDAIWKALAKFFSDER